MITLFRYSFIISTLTGPVVSTIYAGHCCKAWKDPECSAINCENWTRRGECELNPEYMLNMCPDHCNGWVGCQCGDCLPQNNRDAIPIEQPAQAPEPVRLKLNEKLSACVCGAQEWNDLTIGVTPNDSYSIQVLGEQKWWDYHFETTPSGYTNKWIRTICCDDQWVDMSHYEHARKIPGAPWASLGCCLDKKTEICQDVGVEGTLALDFEPTEQAVATVHCFANDVPHFYWDNYGAVVVNITRLT